MDSEIKLLLLLARSEGFPESMFEHQVGAYGEIKKAQKALTRVTPERDCDRVRASLLLDRLIVQMGELSGILGTDAAQYIKQYVKLEKSKEQIAALMASCPVSESRQLELFPIFEG